MLRVFGGVFKGWISHNKKRQVENGDLEEDECLQYDEEFAAEEDEAMTYAVHNAIGPEGVTGPSSGDDPVGFMIDEAIAASMVDVAVPDAIVEAADEVFNAALQDSLEGLGLP